MRAGKARVVVLAGGRSAEREISLLTGSAVTCALESVGYEVATLDADERLVAELARKRPAAVFNALHGGAGEDGTVQALLDWLGFAYQGSAAPACAVAMDKWLTKALLAAEGLPAPRGRCLDARSAAAFDIENEFGLPCVVKPNAQGSAVGVSIVRQAGEWEEAVRSACSRSDVRILVEEYIGGREFTVAVLEDAALPVVEIVAHDVFYSYRAKYTPGGSTHIVPAELGADLSQHLQDLALRAHRALRCRDYSRVDIMLGADRHAAILECNTLPGLTALSLFPDAARAAGISYEQLVERLLLCALSRGAKPAGGL